MWEQKKRLSNAVFYLVFPVFPLFPLIFRPYARKKYKDLDQNHIYFFYWYVCFQWEQWEHWEQNGNNSLFYTNTVDNIAKNSRFFCMPILICYNNSFPVGPR